MSRAAKELDLTRFGGLFFEQGVDATERAIRQQWPNYATGTYRILREDDGARTIRTGVRKDDRTEYVAFNAPSLWEPPYAVLKVRVPAKARKDYFHSHVGEELLVPRRGAFRYHHFWTQGGEPPQRVLGDAFRVGQIVRINPQVPHQGWADGDDHAEGWMILRDIGGNATAISSPNPSDSPLDRGLDPDADDRGKASKQRGVENSGSTFSETELQEPQRYALAAWGVGAQIRVQRERAHLTRADVGRRCGFDPSHLLRIENGSTNVSFAILKKIVDYLGIDLPASIRDSLWHSYATQLRGTTRSIMRKPGSKSVAMNSVGHAHMLHPGCIELKAESTDIKSDNVGNTQRWFVSWIVLAGKGVVDIPVTGDRTVPEILQGGYVAHFRRYMPQRLTALEPLHILTITYSDSCSCG